MSHFIPHAEYAEDQRYARTMLFYHVLHRGLQVGAPIGLIGGGIGYFVQLRRSARPGAARALAPVLRPQLAPLLLRGTFVGALIGAGFVGVSTVMRMYGKEEVEWQDRSWRLLANAGQVEVENWSVGGTVLGAAMAMAREATAKELGRGRALRVFGGAIGGNLLGVGGYMLWRYGAKGGRRNDKDIAVGNEKSDGVL